MIMTVTMNSKDDCPYCDLARASLMASGIPFSEVKWNDDAKRQALYDSLSLVDKQRSVPQVVLFDGHEYHRIGGARELGYEMMGLMSLFGLTTAVDVRVAASRRITDTVGMVEAEEGHTCCE